MAEVWISLWGLGAGCLGSVLSSRNMHAARRRASDVQGPTKGKTIALGILERGGKIRTAVIPNPTKMVMEGHVRANVEVGSLIMSDEAAAHWRMDEEFIHQVVNHMECYVSGTVHTNNLENFWSLLKRSIHGTYVSVEPFHLFRYLDEQAFRYNNRTMTDALRFRFAMCQIVGKRVTYKQSTGKDTADALES